MIDALNGFFNAIGSLPLIVLPTGVGYWLTQLGVAALIGGIATGITTALLLKAFMFFTSPFRKLALAGTK